jgi:hypothetical protein
LFFPLAPVESWACGVGQKPLVAGENKQAFSKMRRACFSRAEQSVLNSVAHRFEFSSDDWQAEGNVSLDVLEEAVSWLDFSDDLGDERP